MKKSLHLITTVACIILFSSCASVFETRNYSHLHYVKEKGNKQEEITMKNEQQDDDMAPISSPAKDQISLQEQQSKIATRPAEKHQSSKSAVNQMT
jgi:hypothetical protein